jgi:hypothetical protein
MGTGEPFRGGKARPGRDADHSPPSSAEVKNEQELYFPSPQTPSWRVAGHLYRDGILPLLFASTPSPVTNEAHMFCCIWLSILLEVDVGPLGSNAVWTGAASIFSSEDGDIFFPLKRSCTHKSTRRYYPEGQHRHIHRHEHLKSHILVKDEQFLQLIPSKTPKVI